MASMNGLVALVTGAGSGIGRSVAQLMARRGALVAIADLSGNAAEQAVKSIVDAGGRAVAVEMDVTSEAQVDAGVKKSVSHFGTGHLDILVSNAGFQYISPVASVPYAQWQKMMAVHLDGSFLTTKAAWEFMKSKDPRHVKGGSIIYMGSVHSKEASVLKSPYVAAKHGIMGFARAVAKEGGEFGIASNVVCPGFVLTPLVEKQIPEQAKTLGITEEEVIRNVMLKNTVDGQFSTLEDVAEVCCFLGAFKTTALTGQSITVSHGWNMS